MEENPVAISQSELDRILYGVRQDNEKNEERITGQSTAAISQSELDNLFSGKSTPVQKVEPVQEKSEDDFKNMTREEKISARKARMEALLAEVNARSPKRVSIIYGSVLTTGTEIDKYDVGTVIELDRELGSSVDILCDGKLIAHGFIGRKNGKVAVKICNLVE